MSDDPDFMRMFGNNATLNRMCLACDSMHVVGQCPLKRSGAEHCGLCGLAHYGYVASGVKAACPHFSSETQVRLMIDSLKMSTEPREIVDEARKYLRGVIGNLVKKKRDAEMQEAARSRPILPPKYLKGGSQTAQSRPILPPGLPRGGAQTQWRVAPQGR
ncbi:hypothetical protein V492_07495 [Pseudogymnoascus sp. VKM F-4246]|nr:hypothetical protein V492_07495 [Pseudogymnoascus sp. VKM F-4246]